MTARDRNALQDEKRDRRRCPNAASQHSPAAHRFSCTTFAHKGGETVALAGTGRGRPSTVKGMDDVDEALPATTCLAFCCYNWQCCNQLVGLELAGWTGDEPFQ